MDNSEFELNQSCSSISLNQNIEYKLKALEGSEDISNGFHQG